MSKAIRLAHAPVWAACAVLSLTSACGAEWSNVAPCDPHAQLRINEVMVRPVSGRSADQWVEIVNGGATDAGTDGLVLDVLTPGREAAHHIRDGTALEPGEHGLLARAAGILGSTHGGLAPTLNLPKRHATLRLRCEETALDVWCYGCDKTPVPLVGHSLMREGLVPSLGDSQMREARAPLLGDSQTRGGLTQGSVEARWCVTHGPPYDGVNVGTPGLRNSACMRCTEGDGVWRDVQAPAAGDLLLKEITRPASGAEDAWVEVYAAGKDPVDLNGLVIAVTTARGTAKRYTYNEQTCLTMPPGASAALGLGKADLRTGRVPVAAVFEGPRVPKEPMRVTLVADDTDVAMVVMGENSDAGPHGKGKEGHSFDALGPVPCAYGDCEGDS